MYDELQLDTLGDKKTALFLIMSDTDSTFNFLISMVYTQLFNLLCDKADDVYGGKLPIHVRCLIDECANIGQIPNLEKLVATIRSREISACLVLQARSQLKAIYKDNADTIVGNMDSQIFLGGSELTTLKDLSEMLGKETIDAFNTSDTRGNSPSYGTTFQKMGHELLSRDELAVLDGGKCILQLRGVRPFLSDKYDLTQHPNYKLTSDYDSKNTFDIEKYLNRKEKINPNDEFVVIDKKLEKELDKKIKRTPADHPGYNEYQYHLDPIEHDPWQLTSFLTTLYDDYTRSEVQGKLKETFKKQYKLTTWVEVQTRYMTVWVISPAGIPVPTQVPYEYKIFHTKLVNRGLEVVIREELDNDQWKRYEIFQDTLGGRPYLFNGGLPPGGSDGSGTPGIDYQIPAEALTDSEFAAIYKEAQKYVGTPYVWGGSTPETGFDCSGYVCWVYNQNGYDVGRTTANGLWNKSQHISEAEAKPGDLVFFEGTYDTPGKSHVGIYLGNGMMVSAGDPIKYANIHSSYWEKHLAGFGRLSK